MNGKTIRAFSGTRDQGLGRNAFEWPLPLEKANTMKQARSWLFYGSLVAIYLTLNSVLNLTNKWVLSSDTGYGFSFPLLLTSCHMAFSFLALLPMMLAPARRAVHAESLGKQWRGLVAVGMFMALNVSLNNTSLVWLALSVNQVIRCGKTSGGSYSCWN